MPGFQIERQLRQERYQLVAGLDEAGRGAWAGPLYAAAVILPLDQAEAILRIKNAHVRDGKRISPGRRESIYEDIIVKEAIAYGAGWATSREVDEFGLTVATQLAMGRALEKLSRQPDYLLLDGAYTRLPNVPYPPEEHRQSLRKGEEQARCIAAASIVAKVERDRYMQELDVQYPGYGFAQHKGYGTQMHRDMLKHKGLCPEHRRSFKPIAALVRR